MVHAIEALVQTVNGSAFAGIDTEVAVTLAGGAKNPMQGRVTKLTTNAHIQLFSNKNGNNGYQNMVNRRLAEEGKDNDFQVSKRVWGTRVAGVPLVEHNGEKYLEAIFIRSGQVQYLLDGQVIDKSQIIGLKETKKYDTQQNNLDNQVILRVFKLSAIKAMRIAGVEVTIK